jgi:dihydroorotate dehydrogenase
MYSRVKPLLFSLSPEQAHNLSLWMIQKGWNSGILKPDSSLYSRKPVYVWGIPFAGRVGLAAGLDKHAQMPGAWSAFGFGFAEVGTLTPRPQAGNPSPRLFRLKRDAALLNRMGFNNHGLEQAVENLKRAKIPEGFQIGGNLGKNKDTPNEAAAKDYSAGMRALCPYVSYFTINISSPNTPGLRDLQEKKTLRALLEPLVAENKSLEFPRPLIVKMAPDLDDSAHLALVEAALESGVDGLMATNTTLDRSGLSYSPAELEAMGSGGISGNPLFKKSLEMLSKTCNYCAQTNTPVVGVGGIDSPEKARAMLDAGATLIQVYTGFVYKGPELIRAISKAVDFQ